MIHQRIAVANKNRICYPGLCASPFLHRLPTTRARPPHVGHVRGSAAAHRPRWQGRGGGLSRVPRATQHNESVHAASDAGCVAEGGADRSAKREERKLGSNGTAVFSTWTQAARSPPIAAVPVATITCSTETSTIFRRTVFSIETSLELPLALAMFSKN